MTTKIAISLPDELVDQARDAVSAGMAPSMSAYIADSLRQRIARESLADIVRDLIAEYGTPSRADRAIARRVLYGDAAVADADATKRRQRRRRAV